MKRKTNYETLCSEIYERITTALVYGDELQTRLLDAESVIKKIRRAKNPKELAERYCLDWEVTLPSTKEKK